MTISSVPGDKTKVCVTYDECMDIWPEIYSIAGAASLLAWDEKIVKDATDIKNVALYTLKSPHCNSNRQESIQGRESCLVYSTGIPHHQSRLTSPRLRPSEAG